jgi:hypothetical protein
MSLPKIAILAEVAAGQWGMITTAQAASSGVSAQVVARLARDDQLERLTHGIYRLAGAPPRPDDEVRALWLAIDPRRTASERIAAGDVAVVSYRSAAVLHQLGDIDADVVEFTVASRHQVRRPDVRIHRGTVEASDWTLIDGLPVTTLLRTISDLASARLDRGHLAGVVRDALIEHNLPVKAAAAILDQHARAYGVTAGDGIALVELMLAEAGVPESMLDVAALSGGTQQTPRSIAKLLNENRSLPPEIAAALQLVTDQGIQRSEGRVIGKPRQIGEPSAASSESPDTNERE